MIYLDWHVGMKVVCIAGSDGGPNVDTETTLRVGDICTISWVGIDNEGVVIDLVEHPAPEAPEWKRGWSAKYFRPVHTRKTDISVFTALLNPTEQDKEEIELADFILEHSEVPFQ